MDSALAAPEPAPVTIATAPPPADNRALTRGLVALQSWLCELTGSNLAQYDTAGILHIHASVAQRFALAFVRDAVMVAMPPRESEWARAVPWDYAAIYRDKTELYLVGKTLTLDDAPVPPLAVSFVIADARKAQQLQRFEQLELRGFAGAIVSVKAFACMPLHILDADENVMDLVDRRGNTFKVWR